MTWIPTELHSHTVHSDGAMEPEQLAQEAQTGGFSALALTDHNTASGRPGYEAEAGRRGVLALPGVELTTFFGHVLVWGTEEAPDWRLLGPSDLGPALRRLGHRASLVVGAAHPFRPGNPYCTGCYWDYDLPFDELDCLEVWSGVDPDLHPDNRRALELWNSLLDQGVAITATAGRDWHRPDPTTGLRSTTLLGVEEVSVAGCLDALKAGRAHLSLGPLPVLEGDDHGVRFGARDSGWGLALAASEAPEAVLVSDRGDLARVALGTDGADARWAIDAAGAPKWLRVEVRARWEGRDRTLAHSRVLLGKTRAGR